MAKKKTFAEKIAAMPTSYLADLTEAEMKAELKKGRYAVTRRLSTFSKQGLTSYAATAYLGAGGQASSKESKNRSEKARDIRARKVDTLSRNQALLELARIQSFFRSETSTVEGQKRINLEQDKAIFGTDGKGRPRETMTPEERDMFWSIYQEYYNQHPETYSKAGASEQVQQIVGEIIKNPGYNHSDLAGILEKIHEAYTEEVSLTEQFTPNILTGHRHKRQSPAEQKAAKRGKSNVRAKRGNRRGR